MKKVILSILILGSVVTLTACSTQKNTKQDYTTKPVFCYQLAPVEQAPGKNCIGSGGHN
ncbi:MULTISPECIES: hypothetical protein [Pasteurellaceae]|uniref:Lipoprotein n=1 Tax=Pasteurella atlantica TaxID=2827233 RepID=A0AAW8CSQ7_9PAST|nr:hypothetical protein [Pasteurella atlantica]MBR0574536.1 hypothetical protein [Pasteurella atlantica]MDP8040403.1 hypothetical protein [Pasteurella atlantica]MDP8042547.1 hypothetical protein [Pasteurella atlantica]MDP8044673.1 hypothetical protein [Pasteurella atlantica]MDP8046698.1 hypothetical protein [Pasteurella atlantica]